MNGMREAGEGRNGGGTKLSKGSRLSRGTMLLGVGAVRLGARGGYYQLARRFLSHVGGVADECIAADRAGPTYLVAGGGRRW
jgi:hypothetical protein